MAPYRDVVKSEFIPPAIKHGLIEAEDAFPSDADWWRRELFQALEDALALAPIHTREQVPEGQGITHASLREKYRDVIGSLLRCDIFEIEACKSRSEFWGRIFEIGDTGTNFGARGAGGAGRNKRFMMIQLEADPSEGGTQQTRSGIVNVQRVGATEVHGHGRGSVHDELPSRRPDVGVDGSTVESDSFQLLIHGDETQAGAGIDIDLANFRRLKAGAGVIVGLKDLADGETLSTSPGDGAATDTWRSGEARDIPARGRRLRMTVAEHQECDEDRESDGSGGPGRGQPAQP